jgi:hypothetical protein
MENSDGNSSLHQIHRREFQVFNMPPSPSLCDESATSLRSSGYFSDSICCTHQRVHSVASPSGTQKLSRSFSLPQMTVPGDITRSREAFGGDNVNLLGKINTSMEGQREPQTASMPNSRSRTSRLIWSAFLKCSSIICRCLRSGSIRDIPTSDT